MLPKNMRDGLLKIALVLFSQLENDLYIIQLGIARGENPKPATFS